MLNEIIYVEQNYNNYNLYKVLANVRKVSWDINILICSSSVNR